MEATVAKCHHFFCWLVDAAGLRSDFIGLSEKILLFFLQLTYNMEVRDEPKSKL